VKIEDEDEEEKRNFPLETVFNPEVRP